MSRRTRPAIIACLLFMISAAAFGQSAGPALDRGSLGAQTALLEATRQDMVTYRLSQLSAQFEYLARDLRSNGITDAALNADLADLADRIEGLRTERILKVKADLNALADGSEHSGANVAAVRREVRRIVRELAVLLLEAGVRHATEVAATRIDDIADRQRRLMDSTPERHQPEAQREVAAELEELLDELRTLVDPISNPLAAVRLARVRKMIEAEETAAHMRDAADAMEAADESVAQPKQAGALEALRQARKKLREQEQGEHREDLRARRLAAARRLDRLRVHQDRQLDFISRAESVAAEDGSVERLLDAQRRQLEDLEALADALPADDKWTHAIRAPIRRASIGVREGIAAFNAGDQDAAMRESRSVVGALRVAADRVERKVTVLENIESHLKLAEDMRYVSGFLGDVEAEQQDIGGQPPRATAGGDAQRVVFTAVGELRDTVEGVAEAATVAEPMKQGEAAMSSLVDNKELPAERATELRLRAEERVGTARQRATAVASRAEYVAQWLEYLGRQQADLLSLLARQIELRERTEREAERVFTEISGEQDVLLGETEAYAGSMEIGQNHYAEAAEAMRQAVAKLNAVDRDQAVFHQKRAEEALRAAAKALADMMGRIADITTLEKMAAYEAEVHIMTKVLMLAVEQRHIRYRTRKATADEMRQFTAREQQHLRRMTLAVTTDERAAAVPELIDSMDEATVEMAEAVSRLKEADREGAIKRQQQAEKILRMFVAELVGELLQPMDYVPEEAEGGGGDSWNVNVAMPMEAVRIFGEAPVEPHQGTEAGASTWEPLNARERAALSENFARELPLEYRSMLKAYYRSLAE